MVLRAGKLPTDFFSNSFSFLLGGGILVASFATPAAASRSFFSEENDDGCTVFTFGCLTGVNGRVSEALLLSITLAAASAANNGVFTCFFLFSVLSKIEMCHHHQSQVPV